MVDNRNRRTQNNASRASTYTKNAHKLQGAAHNYSDYNRGVNLDSITHRVEKATKAIENLGDQANTTGLSLFSSWNSNRELNWNRNRGYRNGYQNDDLNYSQRRQINGLFHALSSEFLGTSLPGSGIHNGENMGGGIGNILGSLAGSFLPFKGGSLLGGMLGGLFGGIFGQEEHNYTQYSTIGPGNTVTLSRAAGSNGNDYRDPVMASTYSLGNYIKQLGNWSGGNFSGSTVGFGIKSVDDDKPSATFRLNTAAGEEQQFNYTDAGATKFSLALLRSAQGLTPTMQAIVAGDNAFSVRELQNNLAFGKNYDAMVNQLNDPSPVSHYTAELERLRLAQDHATASASRFGLAIEPVEQAFRRAETQVKQSFTDRLTAVMNELSGHSYLNNIKRVLDAEQQNIADAKALGIIDTSQITDITRTALKVVMQKLQADDLESVKKSFNDNTEVMQQVQQQQQQAENIRLATVSAQQFNLKLGETRLTLDDFVKSLTSASQEFKKDSAIHNRNAQAINDGWLRQLLLGDLSPLSDNERLIKTSTYYNQAPTQQSATDYLVSLGKAYGRSSTAYAEAYKQIFSDFLQQGEIEALKAAFASTYANHYDVIAASKEALTPNGDSINSQAQEAAFAAGANYRSLLGVMNFANGGIVTGGIEGKDSVPALLMPGEGVLTTTGMQTLANLNQGHSPVSFSTSRQVGNDSNKETNIWRSDANAEIIVDAIDSLTVEVKSLRHDTSGLYRRFTELVTSQVAPTANRR